MAPVILYIFAQRAQTVNQKADIVGEKNTGRRLGYLRGDSESIQERIPDEETTRVDATTGCYVLLGTPGERAGQQDIFCRGIVIEKYSFMAGPSAPFVTIACPLWSPVRDLGFPRDLCRGETTLRGLIKGRSPGRRPESAPNSVVCAEALRLEVLWKPATFSIRHWPLPERNVFGGRHR